MKNKNHNSRTVDHMITLIGSMVPFHANFYMQHSTQQGRLSHKMLWRGNHLTKYSILRFFLTESYLALFIFQGNMMSNSFVIVLKAYEIVNANTFT